ncbi:MAG: hypothetical protein PVG90_09520 [Bacillota bacterium]|jgi:hypothetical protein
MRKCILEDGKVCDNCGACRVCDLDETKICDNCCRCLGDADYRGVEITEIIMPPKIMMRRKKNMGKIKPLR